MRQALVDLADRRAPVLAWQLRTLRLTLRWLRDYCPQTHLCSACGFHGIFLAAGDPIRPTAKCPKCHSLERHRLTKLWFAESGIAPRRTLHFSPERSIRSFIEPASAEYVTTTFDGLGADLALDIERLDLPDESFDFIVCSHVLEHVDDRAALAELYRVLARGGTLLLLTPVCEGWATTYEDPSVVSKEDRRIKFGQHNHLRYYGADLRSRIRTAGFALSEFTAIEPDVSTHGLIRGEKLFICRKS